MVNYRDLIKGKKYELGGIKVGKFVRQEIVLIFTGSQYGETGENTIYPDEEDDFEEIERNAGGSAKNKRSNKNKTTKTRTKKTQKQKSKRFSNKHKNFRK